MSMNIRRLIHPINPGPISELSLPAGLRVLMLAPHPDDFDAIGVTMRFLLRNGNSIHLAVARTGSGIEDVYCPGFTIAQKAALREQEQRDSLRFFGLPEDNLSFLALTNDSGDQPADTPDNRELIVKLVQEKDPDIVLLPHGNDTNSGHRVIYSLLRPVAGKLGRSLAVFLIRDPKTIAMRTDLYMPFGPEEAEWKRQLLRFHDSQQQRNLRSRGFGFDDRILNLNRTAARDLALSQEYAETFETAFWS